MKKNETKERSVQVGGWVMIMDGEKWNLNLEQYCATQT